MPILSYELGHRSTPNPRSTTGARDGHVAAVIKHDTDLRPAQVYSELAANRLAQFLGLPVAIGVAVRAKRDPDSLRFASLKAAEVGLDFYDFTDHDAAFDDDDAADAAPGMHTESGHVSALRRVCQRYPLETAQLAVFDLWIGNDDRPGNLKAALGDGGFGAIFGIDQGASLLCCASRRHEALAQLRRNDFPRFHAFQKLVSSIYCGEMIERICAIPEWAMQAAMIFDDNVGTVTIAEQAEVYDILHERRRFLRDLVSRVLL